MNRTGSPDKRGQADLRKKDLLIKNLPEELIADIVPSTPWHLSGKQQQIMRIAILPRATNLVTRNTNNFLLNK